MFKQNLCGRKPTDRSAFVWNMIGSSMYAASSLLLTYLTIRMVGADEGGMFAFALTIAQLLANIVYYETRNYQVTDTKKQYIFGDYHSVKIINSIGMLLTASVLVVARRYSFTKAILVILVCIYRMLDGYADGYESHFHASGRLDLAGKSMTYRAIISVSVYFILLSITHNTVVSISTAILAGVIGILIFDVGAFGAVGRVELSVNKKAISGILKACFPLFASMFLWTYILSASRIAVDTAMNDNAQAYFQVLFMPVSVINLFATFILKPSLIGLTEDYANRSNRFIVRSLTLLAEIVIFSVVCMALAYFLGPPVLQIISGLDMSQYRLLFTFLIFAGGINAIVYLLYSLLLIFRRSKQILITYVLASVLILFLSLKMTVVWGLWGASASYLAAVSFVMIIFGVMVVSECTKIYKNTGSFNID